MINKFRIYGLLGIKLLLGLAFFAAGAAKLGSVENMVNVYYQIGFGQWFRYLTGILEVTGAVAILVPRTSLYGSAMLMCVMVGAIGTHLFLIGGSFVPALVLGLLCGIVTYVEYKKLNKKGISNA